MNAMKMEQWHKWRLNIVQALKIQWRLQLQVPRSEQVISPSFIAEVDIAAGKAQAMI